MRAFLLVAGAWPGCVLGWLVGWWPAAALAGLALAVLASTRLVPSRSARPSSPPRRWANRPGIGVALATVALAGAAACTAGALAATARDPPAEAVDRTVAITAAVRSVPRQLQPQPGREPSVMVSVRLIELRSGTRTWRVALPARMFAARDGWPDEAQPGAIVTGHGGIELREPGDTEVLVDLVTPARVVRPAEGWAATGNRFRAGLATALTGAERDAASLVAGIALGDESGQTPELGEAMRASGLAHLTAVSGGNIAIVLALVLAVLRFLHGPPWLQWIGSALALTGYTALVGPQPSVVRAAAMGVAALLGILAGGLARGSGVLFGCVFLLLLFAPELALSLGFALSVVATAALLVLAPAIARGIRRMTAGRVPEPLVLALAVAVAAQVATAPLLLAVGNAVSWVAVPANLVAGLAVTPVTVLGLLAALVSPAVPAFAELLGTLAEPPASLIVRTAYAAEAAAAAPWAGDVPAWAVAIALVLAAAGVGMRTLRSSRGDATCPITPAAGQRSRSLSLLAVVAVLVSLVAAVAVAPIGTRGLPQDWRLVACDVGQGSAVLLRTQEAAVLVDTGPQDGGVDACLRMADLAALDAVVLTHYHADHVGDLAAVLEGWRVDQILVGPGQQPADSAREVSRLAAEHRVPITTVAAGQRLTWSGLRSTVLWPRPTHRGSPDDVNNGSLVLMNTWAAGGSALTPGDVEPESQAGVMAWWPPQQADVVVIPHHGSDHQDPRFPPWSGAVAALASAGADNDYGHPAPETLAEYQQSGATVARTDVSGSVAVTWRDGRLELTAAG